jgi:hypothetical protein
METKLEYILTNSYKTDMIAYLKTHPEDFEKAIKLAISDKQPYSWRAAWLLWSCMDKNDKRIHEYLKKIISAIPTKKDNQQRELLMILLRMDLNDNFQGQLFDICIKIWKKLDKNPSLRYNAFKLLFNISKNHPTLSNEIKSLTESHYVDMLSNSLRKSILKLVQKT